MTEIKNYLMDPMWELYHIDNLESFDVSSVQFSLDNANYLKDSFSLERRTEIHNALNWAQLNQDYDFKSIMKDAPVTHELKFSNSEEFQYLMRFKAFMENIEFELLMDDRPPQEF